MADDAKLVARNCGGWEGVYRQISLTMLSLDLRSAPATGGSAVPGILCQGAGGFTMLRVQSGVVVLYDLHDPCSEPCRRDNRTSNPNSTSGQQ